MADRVSTLDDGYEAGDLSVFPQALDTFDELYEVKNNAETALVHSLTYGGNFIVVEDTTAFPSKGLVRVGEELIYYAEKTTGVLKDLKRGFGGSKQQYHPVGTEVSHSVMAEHHNACKDAIYNIEHYLGTSASPESDTYNYTLTALERKFLSPKPSFRAYPRNGQTPFRARFQNFSNKEAVRFLWDFGDGSFSTDESPTHIYLSEGNFSVQLRMVTSLGGSGVVTKNDYIEVRNDKGMGFIYVTPEIGTTSTTFEFVDQTDGDIIQRHWSFGDGEKESVNDPDSHSITHQYSDAGVYSPNLLVIFSDQSLRRINLADSIVVT